MGFLSSSLSEDRYLLTYSGFTVFVEPRSLTKIFLIYGPWYISKGRIMLKLINSLLNRIREG